MLLEGPQEGADTSGKRRRGPKGSPRNPGMSDPAGPFQRPEEPTVPRQLTRVSAPAAPTIEARLGICPRPIFLQNLGAGGQAAPASPEPASPSSAAPPPVCPKSPRPARLLQDGSLGPQPRLTALPPDSRPQPLPGGPPQPRRETQTSSNPRRQRTDPVRSRPTLPTEVPRNGGSGGITHHKRARTVTSHQRRRRAQDSTTHSAPGCATHSAPGRGTALPTVPWERVFNTHNASDHSALRRPLPARAGSRATSSGTCP